MVGGDVSLQMKHYPAFRLSCICFFLHKFLQVFIIYYYTKYEYNFKYYFYYQVLLLFIIIEFEAFYSTSHDLQSKSVRNQMQKTSELFIKAD